jgi:hypothetical protein
MQQRPHFLIKAQAAVAATHDMVIFREHVLSEKPTVPVAANIAVGICRENVTGRCPVQVIAFLASKESSHELGSF